MTRNANMKILVPVDLSPLSLEALQVALVIAQPLQASVTLLRVIENGSLLTTGGKKEFCSGLHDLMSIAKENLKRNALVPKNEHRVEVVYQVKSGNPAGQICHTAIHNHMTLIVMGTHGGNPRSLSPLGSTASKVVSFSRCSVLTIPGNSSGNGLQKILIPVRLVPHALDKFELVRALVKSTNADVVIAGLMRKNEPGGSFNMESLLAYVSGKIEEVKGTCRAEIYFGDNIAHQLSLVAEKERPDLIVINTAMEDCGNFSVFTPQEFVNYNYTKFPVLNLPRPPQEKPEDRGDAESNLIGLIRAKIKYYEKKGPPKRDAM